MTSYSPYYMRRYNQPRHEVYDMTHAPHVMPTRHPERFRGYTDMLPQQPGYNFYKSHNQNTNGLRACILKNPDSNETLFESMDACQSNASCAFSYQCPENANEQPVEIPNLLGQQDRAQVGCYTCVDGESQFQSKALGHYNVDSSNTNCGATLNPIPLTYLKTTAVTGSNVTIGGYYLIPLGSVTAKGTRMSVDTSFTITMNLEDQANNAATGDDSLLATLIVVDSTKWKPPMSGETAVLFSNPPLTSLANPGYVVAGYLFDGSNAIVSQSNMPGVSLVYRDNKTYTVNTTATNVPVTDNRVYDVYGYLALATDDSISYSRTQTTPSFYFNSDAYTYVCAPLPLQPPVRSTRTDGKVLPDYVKCYECQPNGPCYFSTDGPGTKTYSSPNCDRLCSGVSSLGWNITAPLFSLTPKNTQCKSNNTFEYMGLHLFYNNYVPTATKLDLKASMSVTLASGSGNDVVMAGIQVLDLSNDFKFTNITNTNSHLDPTKLVSGINVWGPDPTTLISTLFQPLQDHYMAGPRFPTSQCGSSPGNGNIDAGITRIGPGQTAVVELNQNDIPVVIGQKLGVYGVFGFAMDDAVTINYTNLNYVCHF